MYVINYWERSNKSPGLCSIIYVVLGVLDQYHSFYDVSKSYIGIMNSVVSILQLIKQLPGYVIPDQINLFIILEKKKRYHNILQRGHVL